VATNRWIGSAPAIAQVSTVTIGTYDATTTYNVTINGKTVGVLGQGGSAAATAAALQAALQASTYPEFQEATWTVNSNVITATAATAGVPFGTPPAVSGAYTLATSVAGGTGTISNSTTTVSSGPNDVSLAANWSTGALPANGDDVYFDVPVPALYNLTALQAVTLNTLNISATFAGSVGTGGGGGGGSASGQAALGLPVFNPKGYLEYRPLNFQFLTQGAKNVIVGYGSGPGPQMVRLDSLNAQVNLIVQNTGTSLEANAEAVRWKGTHAGNLVEVTKGTLGVARNPGEVATILTLEIGYVANVQGDANVTLGPGVTLAVGGSGVVSKSGGSLLILGIASAASPVNKINQTDGTTEIRGTGSCVTTATIDGGTLYFSGANDGTHVDVTNLNVGNKGTVSFVRDMRSRQVTNTTLYAGAKLFDSFATVTWGAGGIVLSRCRLTDVTLDLGENRSLLTFA